MISLDLTGRYHASVVQLLRFGLIGIAINLVGYLVYLLLTSLGSTPKLTMTFLYIAGVAIGFWGHRNLTFFHKGNLYSSGTRYMIAHMFGYLINFLILFIFVDKLRYPHQWVQAIAVIVVASFLFVAFKKFVFRDARITILERS